MLSIDTSILLYALNRDAPEHAAARRFVAECGQRDDVAICELVLVELYVLLRNPAVVPRPLGAARACKTTVTKGKRHPGSPPSCGLALAES